MYEVVMLKVDPKYNTEVYNGIQYPHCKIYRDLEITYSGWDSFEAKIDGSQKFTYMERYNFASEIGDIAYEATLKINNKFKDTILSHKDIPGVKYKIKAIVEPIDNGKFIIKRMISFEKLTRNPQSCIQNQT